jgi:hypothetical protein
MTKLKSFKLFFALLCTSFLMVSQLCADPPSDKGQKGKDKGSGKAGNGDVGYALDLSLLVSAGISVGDARRLAVSEGLTGMKPMPPGIRKNLARGKPMPPGIAKTRMPGAYVNQLPRHEGYEWLQVGSDLVLVVTGSLVISDVLEGVFR